MAIGVLAWGKHCDKCCTLFSVDKQPNKAVFLVILMKDLHIYYNKYNVNDVTNPPHATNAQMTHSIVEHYVICIFIA